jgi:hypothetical protein
LTVLAPGAVGTGGDVVLAAVGVDVEDDVDLAAVDQRPDLRVGVVFAGQLVEQVEAHLDGEVLAGVLAALEEHLGFGLVGRDVVADLGSPQLAALVGAPDAEPPDQ